MFYGILLVTLEPGVRLGPCEIESPIGAGGMGEIYRARDTRLPRFVSTFSNSNAFAERWTTPSEPSS